MNKILYFSLVSLYLFSIITVVVTGEFSDYANFLKEMTKESGVYENLTVLFLFIIFFYGVRTLIVYNRQLSKSTFLLVFIFSLLIFLASMEEISWGQHIFHFSSSEYFMEHNLQHEENLHNLVDSNLFSSIIYSSIYTFLVFIPLFYKLFLKNVQWLRYFDLNMHHILIVLFSSSFQLYFYDDFGVYVDMFTHLLALLLFAYVLWKYKSSIVLIIHYFIIIFSTTVFMSYHSLFRFLNMQYEIREMFVVLAVLFIFIEFIQKELSLKT